MKTIAAKGIANDLPSNKAQICSWVAGALGAAGLFIATVTALVGTSGIGVVVFSLGFGVFSLFSSYHLNKLHKQIAKKNFMRLYCQERANGSEDDSPKRPFPGDGTYSYGHYPLGDGIYSIGNRLIENCSGKVTNETVEMYTPGEEDLKWMRERDMNYLRRLKQKNILDVAEPNLKKEAPDLYNAIMHEKAAAVSGSSYHVLGKQLISKDGKQPVQPEKVEKQHERDSQNKSPQSDNIELADIGTSVSYKI